MSNEYTGTIDILKQDIETHPKLKDAIQSHFYRNGKLIDDDNWDESSPIASFKDTYTRDGAFYELEEILMELNVPFDRWSSTYDAGPIYAWYRPDIRPTIIYGCGDLGDQIFTARTLKSLTAGIDTSNNEGLILLGKKFLTFLSEIPDIKPLQDYIKQ